jgi:hypothetical protein
MVTGARPHGPVKQRETPGVRPDSTGYRQSSTLRLLPLLSRGAGFAALLAMTCGGTGPVIRVR